MSVINSQQHTTLACDVSKELNLFFGDFCSAYPEYEDIKNDYLSKEIHLNGVQFYSGFLSGDSKNWKDHIEVPIAIELVMLWAYKTNRILDRKQEVWEDEENIKKTALEHDLMLSCIFSLLNSYKKKDANNGDKVHEIIDFLISRMAYGFWVERKYLITKYSPLEEILNNWEKWYLERNLNFNLVYDYAPLVGLSVSNGDFSILDAYEQDFDKQKRFSNVGQIINDLGDFGDDVDFQVKVYQDLFSDIRNGVVTYPVQAMISEEPITHALKDGKVTEDLSWRNEVKEMISKHGLHEKVLSIANDSYLEHKKFFEKHGIENADLILGGFRMLINNKYLDQTIVINESPVLRSRVVLCNRKGKELGVYDKVQAHKDGLLHKAFSVFIYNDKGELLIQRRALDKYHSGGLWANTCCSHYVSGQDVLDTVKKRMQEELGFSCEVEKKFSFVYNLDCGNGMREHEYGTVLIGKYNNEPITLNPEEAAEVRWISIEDLKDEVTKYPEKFAPWFKKILERRGILKN